MKAGLGVVVARLLGGVTVVVGFRVAFGRNLVGIGGGAGTLDTFGFLTDDCGLLFLC